MRNKNELCSTLDDLGIDYKKTGVKEGKHLISPGDRWIGIQISPNDSGVFGDPGQYVTFWYDTNHEFVSIELGKVY